MVINLPTTITKVDKIFHVGDIHIRNYSRHKEYVQVFRKLKKEIQKRKTSNSIIYVAGDLVHSKTDISPEEIQCLAQFFEILTSVCPVLVILGNHDANLNNKSRLNTLKPIIGILQNPNLFFLDKNSYYTFAQLGISVMEVATDPSKYLPASGLDTEIKIAFHHGAVNLATTDAGFRLRNDEVTLDIFQGFDYVLLGDIHKRQFLQTGDTMAAYCGSLIQQRHSETLDKHGMIVWDLENKSYEEVDIQNDYGYYTLEVRNGSIENWSSSVPLKPRLRIRYYDTTIPDRKKVEAVIRSERKVEEWSIQAVKTTASENILASREHLGNVRDVEFQNKLIEEFLEDLNVPQKTLDLIRFINRNTNSKLNASSKETAIRNRIWKPVKFEFSNMFSYGENNYIDFSDMEGIYGIFGPNASGKSTLFDALCFCLFDKCSRTSKAKDVLNTKKSSFYSKFEFLIDDVSFFIERKGYKAYRDHIKVDVDFYTYDPDGKKVLLNGDQRDSTNKNIRAYVGTYDDFILTALSVQNNGTNFIEKPQRERRELLMQFLDLTLFDELYSIANEDAKEYKFMVRSINKDDIAKKLATASKELPRQNIQVQKIESKLYKLRIKREKLHSNTLDLYKKLKPVTSQRSQKEIEALINQNKLTIELSINQLNENISYLERLQELHVSIETQIEELPSREDLKSKDDYRKSVEKEISKINNELYNLTHRKSHFEDLIQQLHTHEYNPQCEFCVKHPIVVQGNQAQIFLIETEELISQLKTQESTLLLSLEEAKAFTSKLRLLDQLENKKLMSFLEIENFKNNTLQVKKTEVQSLKFNLSKLQEEKKSVEKNIAAQEYNIKIQEKIDQVNNLVKDLDQQIREGEREYLNHEKEKARFEIQIQDLTTKLEEFEQIAEQYEAYDLYLKAIKTDGIPYKLTEDILPVIELEINELLDGIANFQVLLETDNKNINAYITYDNENTWPVESGSGMEKFMSSLAIRVALIRNASLPKPDFICIDEGFGVLDVEHLSNLSGLFSKLNDQFECIFCMSHLVQLKDVVDKFIYVHKEDFSYIQIS